MKSSSEYRAMARESLRGVWNESALAVLIIYAIACIFSVGSVVAPQEILWLQGSLSGVQVAVSLLLIVPLGYGFNNAMLSLVRCESNTPTNNMLAYFKRDYSRSVPALVLVALAQLGLGIVTLGVGIVILAYAYAMVPYLLRDYPELTATEALRTSRQMMKGHKWDLFVLDFTFIGWMILCCFTLGIGFIWLQPYMSAAHAHFYEDLKAEMIVEE